MKKIYLIEKDNLHSFISYYMKNRSCETHQYENRKVKVLQIQYLRWFFELVLFPPILVKQMLNRFFQFLENAPSR